MLDQRGGDVVLRRQGLEAQASTSAPPALSARNRLAVSQVICRQRAQAQTPQRLALGELFADVAQHRHLLVGPQDAAISLLGQPSRHIVIFLLLLDAQGGNRLAAALD